ncbi:single-stranded DNA-binding protein [candidate division CSSED10-310 bacterium]|uniref:Single-stranded DNA-binding protein n=1 Tax=candidate division CSSED10-310 bacterium TaxID=2855610 RepID=A0ABV6YUY5_UNCC1
MVSYNRITIAGNLVRDPELRFIPSGTPVCTFAVAVNRRYKQGEEWKESTCFVDIEVWGRLAETSGEYLKKGRPVLLEGRLDQDRWESQDGSKRSKHKIVATQVIFLGGRGDVTEETMDKPVDNDIPF